jgi:ureidoacrylate peracid hydrolase
MSASLPDRWSLSPQGAADLSRPRPAPRLLCIEARPDPVIVDMTRSALVVIDMQNDFIDDAGWFAAMRGVNCAPLRAVVAPINALAAAFRAGGGRVLHVNTGLRADLANLPAGAVGRADDMGRRPGFGAPRGDDLGPVMQAGQWGAESHNAIHRAPGDITVLKHRYSGFRDNELDQLLRRLDVATLFFTGVNLDRCVFATLIDGAFQGFDPILVRDACETPSPDHARRTIIELVEMLYGFTTTSGAILAARDPATPEEGH